MTESVEELYNLVVPHRMQTEMRINEIVKKAKIRAYMKAYNQRPDIKIKNNMRAKIYNQRPYVKANIRAYHEAYYKLPSVKEKAKIYAKIYTHKPENKIKKRAYDKNRHLKMEALRKEAAD